ncbi:MAG: carboxypeptidase-like regulatory domain-containing protein [Anaerolineae bacterium]
MSANITNDRSEVKQLLKTVSSSIGLIANLLAIFGIISNPDPLQKLLTLAFFIVAIVAVAVVWRYRKSAMTWVAAMVIWLVIALGSLAVFLSVPAKISGSIVNNGSPLVGLTLILTDSSGVDHKAITGLDGRYEFGGVPAGNYTISANGKFLFGGSSPFGLQRLISPSFSPEIAFEITNTPTATFTPTDTPTATAIATWCDSFEGNDIDASRWYLDREFQSFIYVQNEQLHLDAPKDRLLDTVSAEMLVVQEGQPISEIAFDLTLQSASGNAFAGTGLIFFLENGRDFKILVGWSKDGSEIEYSICRNTSSSCDETVYEQYDHPDTSKFTLNSTTNIRIVSNGQTLKSFAGQALLGSSSTDSDLIGMKLFLYVEPKTDLHATVDNVCVTN